MFLLWASLLLYIVQAGPKCRSVEPVPKGQTDKCNAKEKIEDCYGEKGCEWVSAFQKILKEPWDIKFGSNDKKPGDKLKEKKGTEGTLNPKLKGVKFDISHERIMHYNVKDGKVDIYKYNSEFVKYYKSKPDNVLKPWSKFLIPYNKPKSGTTIRRLGSSLEISNTSNATNGDEYHAEELIISLVSNRRRLPAGAAAPVDSETVHVGPATLPNAVGRLKFTSWFKADRGWPDTPGTRPARWSGSRGVGALVKAVQEGDKYYEYILTAGHNLYEFDLGEDAPPEDKRRFSRQIKFARANNHARNYAFTNEANELREVWIGYYSVLDDFNNNNQDDWAILKYEVQNAGNAGLAATPAHAPDDHAAGGFSLIGYYSTNKQQFWDPVEVRDPAADIYKVPYYTRVGVSGSPLFARGTNRIVGVHHGKHLPDSIHMRISKSQESEYGLITSNRWGLFKQEAVDWNWRPVHFRARARDINLNNRLINDFESYDGAGSHGQSLHHKKSVSSGSALDLNIPNHDINIHHYYHHEHGYEDKYEHDTYSDGYSEYNYNYEQTKLLLVIPLILLTICIVCIGCLCCAGFGGIAGWFIKHESKGSIKNRKNDYIQALNDNEVSEI